MKQKILYIDDEIINLELFGINFNKDYEIITSDKPVNALSLLKTQTISVVITDYKMPEINGFELIQNIKTYYPETVCIMLSGFLESKSHKDSNLIFRHIMKPYKKDDLRKAIEDAFACISNK